MNEPKKNRKRLPPVPTQGRSYDPLAFQSQPASIAPNHVRWAEGVALCGAVATDHQMVDPAVMVATLSVPGTQTGPCLECLQLLSELCRYREDRLSGVPEYTAPLLDAYPVRVYSRSHGQCQNFRFGDVIDGGAPAFKPHEVKQCPQCTADIDDLPASPERLAARGVIPVPPDCRQPEPGMCAYPLCDCLPGKPTNPRK